MTTTEDHADLPPTTPLAPDAFRTLLRRLAATVVVVTADSCPPVGFTATSFTSVSLRPALVSFCVDRSSSSWPAIRSARHIGVHLLSQRQEGIARRFAARGIDRFGGVEWHRGPHGVALLADPLVWLVCRVTGRVDAGDHTIVLSEPVHGDHLDQTLLPLVYHMGDYLTAPPPTG
jgi:flavin reductase (DIM6/NTAB) family NADH-FMN oxidoreductase RutF